MPWGYVAGAVVGYVLNADNNNAAQDANAASADASKAAADTDRQRFELQKQLFNEQAPLRQAQLAAAERALPRNEQEDKRLSELTGKVIDEADQLGGEADQEAVRSRAIAADQESFDAADASRTRSLRSLGLAKPGDASYTAGARAADVAKASTLAKTGSDARESTRLIGQERRLRVAGMKRGFNPNTAAPVPSASLSGSASAAAGAANAATNFASMQNNLIRSDISEIGRAVGRGTTPSTTTATPGSGPAYGDEIAGFSGGTFADGGPVAGPGGPTDDAVPAVVDGKEPAALSSGEFVIKADSVKKYGPRLLREVNEGTAIIVPTHSPRKLAMVKGVKNAKSAA